MTANALMWFAVVRAVIWTSLVPLVFVFPQLQKSVPFLVAISILAGWEGAVSAIQAARAEKEAS